MTKNFLIVLAVIYPMTYNFMGYEMTIVKAIQASTVLIMAMMMVLNEGKK